MKRLIAVFLLAMSLAAQTARETTEFTIFKRAEPLKILPGVEVALKAADAGKQRFTVDLIVDGHKIEKKDQDIKIPIFFYVGNNTQAHEFVVAKVGADQIVGKIVGPK